MPSHGVSKSCERVNNPANDHTTYPVPYPEHFYHKNNQNQPACSVLSNRAQQENQPNDIHGHITFNYICDTDKPDWCAYYPRPALQQQLQRVHIREGFRCEHRFGEECAWLHDS